MLLSVAFVLSSCSKEEETNLNINEFKVEKSIDNNNNVIYTALNQEGQVVSELLFAGNQIQAKFNNNDNKVSDILYILKDNAGNIIEQESIMLETQQKWIYLAAAIILWCVDGNISYSQSGGWSGSIGFDCFAIANPGPGEYPQSYAPTFNIKAIN